MILDISCGGSDEFPKQSSLKADLTVDIRKPKNRNGNFVLASAEALPFQDKVFSCAVAFDVIEHVNGPIYMVQEMKRVARKILLSTPNGLHLPTILMSLTRSAKAQPHPDHVNIWNKAEMEALLRRVGFQNFDVTLLHGTDRNRRWFVKILTFLCPFPALAGNSLIVTARSGLPSPTLNPS